MWIASILGFSSPKTLESQSNSRFLLPPTLEPIIEEDEGHPEMHGSAKIETEEKTFLGFMRYMFSGEEEDHEHEKHMKGRVVSRGSASTLASSGDQQSGRGGSQEAFSSFSTGHASRAILSPFMTVGPVVEWLWASLSVDDALELRVVSSTPTSLTLERVGNASTSIYVIQVNTHEP